LLFLKIKVGDEIIKANVYKDDTANSVSDRILRHLQSKGSYSFIHQTEDKEKKKQMA